MESEQWAGLLQYAFIAVLIFAALSWIAWFASKSPFIPPRQPAPPAPEIDQLDTSTPALHGPSRVILTDGEVEHPFYVPTGYEAVAVVRKRGRR